jgi:uncharacterized protein with ParB-like and HNH nuclease domain
MTNLQTFKPDNMTISDLLSCDAIYVIPNYQRQYSWAAEELEELWNDLYEAFSNNKDECYFLGSVVVVDDNKSHHEIVDGQQRITTIMVMLNVLLKTFPDINKDSTEILRGNQSKLKKLVFFDEEINRLQLQSDPNYDTIFKNVIIKPANYDDLEYPSQSALKQNNPEPKYKYAAKYFYDRFKQLQQELGDETLGNFVNYILFKTNIIKIICNNQSFAIKLFLVLNDRGMELSVSDIVKSYILDKYSNDRYDDNDRNVFNANWKHIEDICNNNGITTSDFLVLFEYYKLRSNPKRQVTDELKKIIQDSEINALTSEMRQFADNYQSIFVSTDKTIYSLRYIPWRFYIMTVLTTAYQVSYPNMDALFDTIRRFFYICWVSGKTLTGIKQTAFNLIDSVASQKPIAEIKKMLDDFIISKKMIRDFYEAIDDNVYGEGFLKPLLFSVEYEIRESTNTTFYEIDNNIHLDHILPQRFESKQEEWDNITDISEAYSYLDTIGNMALLQGKKNEEALNHGFRIKMDIYSGYGKTNGKAGFDTTQCIVDEFNKGDDIWNVDHIKKRKEFLVGLIEKMLDLSRESVDDIGEDTNDERARAKRLNFARIGISAGETVEMWHKGEIKASCVVVDEYSVLYNGQPTSLTKIAKDITGFKTIAGPSYFKYNGKWINDIRREKGELNF